MRPDIQTFDFGSLKRLREMADASKNGRERLSFHDLSDGVQEMMICLNRGSYVRPHRHPAHKSESYTVLFGSMVVRLFTEDGRLDQAIRLDHYQPYYRMTNGWYHQPVSLSDFCLYHEVLQGPFNKEIDVDYAPWAKAE